METTLAELIRNCVKGLGAQEHCSFREELNPGRTAVWVEKNQLALNALEERFQELIEAKVNQMLKRA